MNESTKKAQENRLLEFLLSPGFDGPKLDAFTEFAEKIRIEWPLEARIDLVERWRMMRQIFLGQAKTPKSGLLFV